MKIKIKSKTEFYYIEYCNPPYDCDYITMIFDFKKNQMVEYMEYRGEIRKRIVKMTRKRIIKCLWSHYTGILKIWFWNKPIMKEWLYKRIPR